MMASLNADKETASLNTPKKFAYTHPKHIQELYELAGGCNLYGRAVRNARDFASLAQKKGLPDLLIIGNLLESSTELAEFCSEHGVDRVYGEFGWFPHYTTVHADPVGYAWESSLCQTKFSGITDKQRFSMSAFRNEYLSAPSGTLPKGVFKPFVFWPLQLISDRVNKHDLNLPDWFEVLLWTRQLLPKAYQLVIKDHPVPDGISRTHLYDCLPNTIILDRSTPLRPLIENSHGVIGCNSTVLLEARLMFRKPTWAYGRSWYSGHPDLVIPVVVSGHLPKPELLGKYITDSWSLDYGDWFLLQLLLRQYPTEKARKDPTMFVRWINQRSFHSYERLGTRTFGASI
jgi:Capsule polysaccharide biosynthesis protein